MIEIPAPSLQHAFKEWAVAVEALYEGKSIVTVRKGGIREDGREFRMEHRRFLLFPTYEHQKAEQLNPEYAATLDGLQRAYRADRLQVRCWAEVTDVLEFEDQESVLALSDFYVFSPAYALERLQWRPRKPLHALVLRVYQLPVVIEVPMEARYGGCKSWIDLDATVSLAGSVPALDDEIFAERRAAALRKLRDLRAASW